MSTETSTSSSVFWDDLAEDLQNPEFRHHYILESERIASIDRIVNQLDEIRAELGLSKADLARSVERRPEAIRRLLTSHSANPQLSLVAEMAAALGYRVELVPMSEEEREEISVPLRELVHA
jgi:DNA-binding XRE family transcriptional regulator